MAVLPVTGDHHTYATHLRDRLHTAGLRAHVDGDGPLGPRVHTARERRVPCTVVVGDREAANGTAAVRSRGQQHPDTLTVDELIGRLTADNANRATTGW